MRPHDIAYPYVTVDGELVYEKLRYSNPKDFRVRRPNPAGGWLWGLADDTPRVLYRLPELLDAIAAPADRPTWVWVVAGEKDTDNLWSLGLPATTNFDGEGAGKWRDEYSRTLAGRRVVIVEDNDQAGREWCQDALGSLMYHGAAAVKVVRFDDLGDGADVSDWLDSWPRGVPAEAKRSALIRKLMAAPAWGRLSQTEGDDSASNREVPRRSLAGPGPRTRSQEVVQVHSHAAHRQAATVAV